MSEFMDDILQSFYVKIHSFQENNWDFERYISLGKDADKTFFIEQYKYYLNYPTASGFESVESRQNRAWKYCNETTQAQH